MILLSTILVLICVCVCVYIRFTFDIIHFIYFYFDIIVFSSASSASMAAPPAPPTPSTTAGLRRSTATGWRPWLPRPPAHTGQRYTQSHTLHTHTKGQRYTRTRGTRIHLWLYLRLCLLCSYGWRARLRSPRRFRTTSLMTSSASTPWCVSVGYRLGPEGGISCYLRSRILIGWGVFPVICGRRLWLAAV